MSAVALHRGRPRRLGCRDPRVDERQSLPLLGLSADRRGGAGSGGASGGHADACPSRTRAPTSADQALAAGADAGTMFLAGGTELLNWMRLGIAAPERVARHLAHRRARADRVDWPDGGLRIGALVRLNDAAQHPTVVRDYPVLSQAILKAASAQLRNLATIGGNPLQKTRCAYFRAEETLPCNKRVPGSGCSARHGLNDKHAIFGWTDDCVATQPSDPAVALAALDAVFVTAAPRRRPAHSRRRVPHLAGRRAGARQRAAPRRADHRDRACRRRRRARPI